MSSEIAAELSKQTRELVERFELRADSFRERSDLCRLLIDVDPKAAEAFARGLFGLGRHVATGIDGSMDFDERLQMMVFYANATAYSCPFEVGGSMEFDLDAARRDEKLAASAAVPLWAEDLGNVLVRHPEVEIELEHSMERIPNSFMTLGELYLAYQACTKSSIIILDRPLSGTYSTLCRDARNLLKLGESRLAKWNGGNVSMLDIDLAVNLGGPAMEPPTRRRFLHLAMIKALLEGPKSLEEISEVLSVRGAEVHRAAEYLKRLNAGYDGALLSLGSNSRLKLNEDVSGYWDRVTSLSLSYARDVFTASRHPLSLEGGEYLTILDVNTIALIFLLLIYELASKRQILLIGMAKDTTATDITRSVLPYATSSDFARLSSPAPRMKNDRAFLAILSSENPSTKTPWRTVGYDSSYSTMVEVGGKFVSARKFVSREMLFVRCYFQLRALRSDPSVRSPVFLFDRPFDTGRDIAGLRVLEAVEKSGPTRLSPYFEGDTESQLSNLILHILSLNDNPEVFEAFGHNQLLYLADKAVKAEVRMLRSSLRGVADLRVGGVSRRRKIFGLVSPFREQRSEAERARVRQ